MSTDLDLAFVWMGELFDELRLPGVSRGTFMGRPSLQHRGKSIIGSKDGENMVVHCPLDLKEVLLAANPAAYFETDHYKGYPALLVRPRLIDKATLRIRIETAWRMFATRQQLSDFENRAN